MTHEEFSSKGGKASKGTDKAKERAKKGAAARWGHIPLDERSPTVQKMKEAGKIVRAGNPDATENPSTDLQGPPPHFQPDEYTQEMPEY